MNQEPILSSPALSRAEGSKEPLGLALRSGVKGGGRPSTSTPGRP